MKKTLTTSLLLTALSMSFACGMTATKSATHTEIVTIKTNEEYIGGIISYKDGILDYADLHDLTFDYKYSAVTTAGALIYTGVNSGSAEAFGFWATENGSITGAWKANNHQALADWTTQGTVASTVFKGLDTDTDGTVKLTAWLDKSGNTTLQGTYLAAGDAVTSTGSSINASNTTASTTGNLYGATSLRGSNANTSIITVNTDYISNLYVEDTIDTYTYTNANSTWSKEATTKEAYNVTSSETKFVGNTRVVARKDIIIGGSGLLFLQSNDNAGSISISNDIYIGKSTNDFGSVHFGNNKAGSTTTLDGDIYLVEDEVSITSRGTEKVTINGNITDKNVSGSSNTEGGYKLLLKGGGYDIKGLVDVTSLEFSSFTHSTTGTSKSQASFSKGFSANHVIMGADSNISSDVTISGLTSLTVKGNAILSADLDLTGASTLQLDGVLALNGNTLTIDTITLNGAMLIEVLALNVGQTVTLFDGVSSLLLGGQSYAAGALDATNAISFSDYFNYATSTSTVDNAYYLGYNSNGSVYVGMIPEPTTATLSLLALAGLAARRRRK